MKEIQSLHIKNFQSHKDTTIDFCKGLNVIVGESRNGKTTILRALRWLYFNEPRGNSYIRAGETRCEVGVTLVDGTQIERIRDNKVNCYVLNIPGQEEQVFSKFNADVPLEVQQALGVSKLWIDKDKAIALNFAYQMEPAFLITDSRGNRAKIIGRIVNLHVIDSACRSTMQDLKNTLRKKNNLEQDLVSLREKMVPFQDLPGKEAALNKARSLLAQAQALQKKANKLEEISTSIRSIQTAISDNKAKLEHLQNIEIADAIVQQIVTLQQKCFSLEEISQNITTASNELTIQNRLLVRLNRLSEAETVVAEVINKSNKLGLLENLQNQLISTKFNYSMQVEIVNKLQNIDAAIKDLCLINKKVSLLEKFSDIQNQINENAAKLQLLKETIKRLKDIDKGRDEIATLYNLRERGYQYSEINSRIKVLKNQLQIQKSIVKKLDNVDSCQTNLSRIQLLSNRLGKIQESNTRIKDLTNQLKVCQETAFDAEEKCLKLRDKYTELLGQIDICPTCHTTLTPEIITQLAN